MEDIKKPSMSTTGSTDRAGIPQNHQTNHQRRPPRRPITEVPAAIPEMFNIILTSAVSQVGIFLFTCNICVETIDQDDVRNCRKSDESHKEHFYLKVSMAGKSNEQADEEAQSA